MSYQETIRYKLEVDPSSAQASMASSIASYGGQAIQGVGQTAQFVGSSMAGAYGTVGQAYGYASNSMSNAANTYLAANAQYRYMAQAATHFPTDGMHRGILDASAVFKDPSVNAGGAMTSAALYTGATVTGWSAVARMAPEYSAFYKMGAGAMKAMKFGAVGTKLGGWAAGLSGLVLPYMVSDAVVESVFKDINERSELASAMGEYSQRFADPALNIGGSGFSVGQRRGMASYVQSLAHSMDKESDFHYNIGTKGLTEILHKFSRKIFRDPNLTPQKFREVFSEKAKQVKEFAIAFDKSITEAIDAVKILQRVAPGTDPISTAMRISVARKTAGLTTEGMIGVAQTTGGIFQQAGLSRATGAHFGIQTSFDVGTMRRMGLITKSDLQRMGGAGGAARTATQMQAAFSGSPMGSMILAAAYKDGKIDPNIIQGIISGNISTPQMLNMASGLVAGGPQAMSNFYAHREQLAASVSAPQQQALIGAMAIRSLNQAGVDVNQANLITAFRTQFHMQAPMARMMANRILHPGIYARQASAIVNQMHERALTAERSQGVNSMTSALYRASGLRSAVTATKGFLSDARRAFRQGISEPIGDVIHGAGKLWGRLRDSLSHTTRYTLTNRMRSLDVLGGDISDFSAGTGVPSLLSSARNEFALSILAGRIIKDTASAHVMGMDVGRAVHKIRKDLPDWVRLYEEKKEEYASKYKMRKEFILSVWMDNLSKAQKKEVWAGIQDEVAIANSMVSGFSNFRNIAVSERYKKTFLSPSSARAMQEMLRRGHVSARNAISIARRFGVISDMKGISSDQTEMIGAMVALSGSKLDRSLGGDLNRVGAMYTKGLIEKAKAKMSSISSLVRSRAGGLWSSALRLHALDAMPKVAPFQYMYGTSFTRVAQDMSKEVQTDIVELEGLMIKSNNDPATAKRIYTLAQKLRSTAMSSGITREQRGELMKMVNQAIAGVERNENGNVVGGNWTTSDKMRKMQELKMGDRMLNMAKGARQWLTYSGSTAVAAQYVRKMSLGLSADKKGRDAIVSQITGEGIGGKGDLDRVMKLIRSMPQDVRGKMSEIGDLLQKKKFSSIADIMSLQAGAYGRVGRFVSGLRDIKKIGSGDFLAGAGDDKTISGLLSIESMKKIRTEKDAQRYYMRVRSELKKLGRYDFELGRIDSVMSRFSSSRDKLIALRKITLGHGKDEGGQIAGMLLGSIGGISSGEHIATSHVTGVYSEVASKQIQLMNQQLKVLRVTYRTMTSLHKKISSSPMKGPSRKK